MKQVDILLFTKHLATMIKSGMPITDALDTLVSYAKSKKFKNVLKSVLSKIENGKNLSDALKDQGKIFDELYINLIKIGEESGTLEENLEFLANQLSKDYGLKKKVQGALLYPTIVLAAAFIMGGFISIFVLPKLLDLFSSFDVALPLSTRILLFVANAMQNYGILIFGGIALLVAAFILLLKIPQIKMWWDTNIIKVPLFGELIKYGQLARFSRNFGILIKSGVPISRSILVVSETLSNAKFSRDLYLISESLGKGNNIGSSMESKKYFEFPALVSRMILVGEKTGKLDETLLYLGDFYEEEIDNVAKNLTTILEPIMLIIIGLVVGFVALAIISPIYELTGSIR